MEVWPAPAHSNNSIHFSVAGNASVTNNNNSTNNNRSSTTSPSVVGGSCSTQSATMVTLDKASTPNNNGGFTSSNTDTSNSNSAHDQAQFEADKRAVYKHPLFPLLALLFERCELATQSSEAQSSDSFNLDIQAFVQHQERDRKPFLTNDPEIDGLMIKAIQVLRIHLLELEKVQELCKDFCNRYITCLKGKMQSENLLRSDYNQGIGSLENNNNMMNHSESGSNSNSPIQSYAISPNQQMLPAQSNNELSDGPYVSDAQSLMHSNASNDNSLHLPPTTAGAMNMSTNVFPPQAHVQNPPGAYPASVANSQTPPTVPPPIYDNHIIHGSTPLGQIGVSVCPIPSESSLLSGQLSPAPTTPGGSADDCDSDFTSRASSGTHSSSRKQKRGVLPKHATSVMRSWLFQHLVHPYPTEDEKRNIAAQTNLTLLQVNNWFINARRRILQPMLDASVPGDNTNAQVKVSGSSQNNKKKHNINSSKRFWPDNLASLQPNAGVLSSSDDDCDSYSSDGDEGNLVIDASSQGANPQDLHNRNQSTVPPPIIEPSTTAGAAYSNHSSESEHQ
ncbi:homeobox protein PKNOX2-like isoform X2 [Chrysoperla carnea]|uniref:homeobox protein PKNOX2-like isoform X2 n=1 Tax=Chrysoperla carnea TaxID=189513 RepID=UPI001D08CD4F|nr:homeobox protein PKNOX2-like isoform X2 [Chrysoperla carnea]